MSLSKLFQRIFWHNNTTPAINEDNLNAMSKAIDDIDDRVILLGDDVLTVVPQIQAYLDQAEDLVDAMETLSQNPPYIGANGNWYTWDTETQAYVDSNVDASITVDIEDITMLATDATPYVTNTGTDTDPIFHLYIPRGETGQTGATGATPSITANASVDSNVGTPSVTVTKTGTDANPVLSFAFVNLKGETGQTGATGADGVGISSIVKTGSSGLVDTYTITLTNGNSSTFTVTNGENGIGTPYQQTLAAGNTSVTFSNVTTTANSIVSVGTSVEGLEYNSISKSGDSYTVTFDTQASAVTVYLIVTEVQ